MWPPESYPELQGIKRTACRTTSLPASRIFTTCSPSPYCASCTASDSSRRRSLRPCSTRSRGRRPSRSDNKFVLCCCRLRARRADIRHALFHRHFRLPIVDALLRLLVKHAHVQQRRVLLAAEDVLENAAPVRHPRTCRKPLRVSVYFYLHHLIKAVFKVTKALEVFFTTAEERDDSFLAAFLILSLTNVKQDRSNFVRTNRQQFRHLRDYHAV